MSPPKRPRLVRRAPVVDESVTQRPDKKPTIKREKMVRIGGIELPPHLAAFLSKYLEQFNGAEAARHIGTATVSARVIASELLTLPNVRMALRGALEERRDRAERKVSDVARYWWEIATADARELSQHVYEPCRHCWGVDHDYQFTDVEQRDREREYHRQVAKHQAAVSQLRRSHPDAELPEAPLFFEGGGAGYTTNRYPMRGPDWVEKVLRTFSEIGRPVPEGLEANSDHSCPACHGDGVSTVWLADTRHLSREAALVFAGAKVGKYGVEIRTLDRMDAMARFEQLMGMSGPHRIELSGPGGGPISVAVKKIESRVVDADYADVTEEVLSRVIEESPARQHQLPPPAVKTRVA